LEEDDMARHILLALAVIGSVSGAVLAVAGLTSHPAAACETDKST
jgi:hypothetical protein